MTQQPERSDRWSALDFGPPSSAAGEPEDPVLLEQVSGGRVAIITLNRPSDNAITTEMGARLTEVLETVAVSSSIRVAIITGAGTKAFSVGSDLRQRQDMTKEQWLRQRQAFDRTLYTLRQLRKPICGGRQRDRVRRRVGDRSEHRLHHRLRQRDLRSARVDDRSGRRRRVAGAPSTAASSGKSHADVDDG